MKWYELAENPQAITELYREAPSLQMVEILKVVWQDEKSSFLVFLDLPSFADTPPAKWVKDGYNAIQVCLEFLRVEFFQALRWSTENCVDVQIEPVNEGRILFRAVASSCHLEVVACAFRFVSVNGYLRGVF